MTAWPIDAYTVAPIWRSTILDGPSAFATYKDAVDAANIYRGRGVACVIRRGDVVYRDLLRPVARELQ